MTPEKFSLKENERDARERLRAFWAGSSLGRPALYVTASRPGYQPKPWTGPELDLKGKDVSTAWQVHVNDNELLSTVFLAEAMPRARVIHGSSLVLVAVLSGAEYDYESDSAWVKPIADLWKRPLPKFDPAHPLADLMRRHLQALAGVVGRGALVNPPIMLDGLTTLSQFRTPAQLCLDCIEAPEEVRKWSDALTTVYIETYEYFYQFVKKLGYGDTMAWLSAMAEGRMEAVQTDFSVMLSPEMFERFALPDLRRLTEYLDFSLYHLDGTCQMRFLDHLRTLKKLNGIQWNPEPPANPPTRWIAAFKEIRRRKFSLHIWVESVEDAVFITKALGPDGLLLVLPSFGSPAEADAAIKKVQAAVR